MPERLAYVLGSPTIVGLTLALVAAGAGAVYAATYSGLLAAGSTPYRYMVRDLMNLTVAVALASTASAIGHRRLSQYAPVGFVVTVVALALVLTPLGSNINGANAWFALGPVQLEPSQLTVLALILLLARLLTNDEDPEQSLGLRQLVRPLVLAGLAVVLILAEPALGMALVLVIVGTALFALAGLKRGAVATLAIVAVLTVIGGAQLHVVKPYQQQRLSAFLHPSADTSSGYQTLQSLVAVGSGGVSGQGVLQGQQTNGAFVPEQRTDFIFTVIAEETGFLGSTALLGLLVALCLAALRVATQTADRQAHLLAAGIGIWFALQTFINVGMTLGIMPVTGIPLPFISYGGSGLFVDMISVGLLCSISREQRTRRTGLKIRRVQPSRR